MSDGVLGNTIWGMKRGAGSEHPNRVKTVWGALPLWDGRESCWFPGEETDGASSKERARSFMARHGMLPRPVR